MYVRNILITLVVLLCFGTATQRSAVATETVFDPWSVAQQIQQVTQLAKMIGIGADQLNALYTQMQTLMRMERQARSVLIIPAKIEQMIRAGKDGKFSLAMPIQMIHLLRAYVLGPADDFSRKLDVYRTTYVPYTTNTADPYFPNSTRALVRMETEDRLNASMAMQDTGFEQAGKIEELLADLEQLPVDDPGQRMDKTNALLNLSIRSNVALLRMIAMQNSFVATQRRQEIEDQKLVTRLIHGNTSPMLAGP